MKACILELGVINLHAYMDSRLNTHVTTLNRGLMVHMGKYIKSVETLFWGAQTANEGD